MPDSTPGEAVSDPGLARVNALPPAEFHTEFARCLDVDRWVRALAAERPFASREALLAAADTHARGMTDDEVRTAIARHPRIGERAQGTDTESRWSRGEQSAVTAAGADAEAAFRAANAAYEARFGHIYLVCASGRSSQELLDDLKRRMDNDPAAETRVVADEFRKIALVRVGKVVDGS
ncbi:2-oxo-4-hydroxy-4-carboxy-5-ureidoimidazoline decarboxylase [Nocardiopsis mwathae]|uniref:2-oxo-4-hydroxy-4-carboxy-5-ureidoimidazoline decarboxylase n=1 Tax=Nocardiopsis mwathae TaxID=1472723 RepID=A0A7W9YF98_9ACTN|nr:2-oxo-4-hydroxy-4-carboxy-5-ureidoimidazoline decarboxylase [Nocardiopsis mwathae]MBB6170880.1 2-oxo-4-hydroxy-4-carboxy-5-ureidoimidazoline decarboxylase [Nocardiopsis mwathae]